MNDVRPFPVSVQTRRLALRLPSDEDAVEEHAMIHESLDHLWPWFSFKAEPPTVDDRIASARKRREDAAGGTGAHYVLDDGTRLVGAIWIDLNPQERKAEIGWRLHPNATGHGYATEALRALCGLARDLGVERIEAFTDPDNTRSRALAERAGFTLDAIKPDMHDRPDGVRRPGCVYVLDMERLSPS